MNKFVRTEVGAWVVRKVEDASAAERPAENWRFVYRIVVCYIELNV